MITPQGYIPARDDLFLYRLEQVTYGSVTQTLLRPYAWNPNSALYGYRNSLQALRASNRTFTTYAGGSFGIGQASLDHWLAQIPNTPQNQPVYYNSWPPTWVKASDQHLWMCSHCFNVDIFFARDPNSSFATFYQDSLQVVMGFRWITSDNQILDFVPSDFSWPYMNDGDFLNPVSLPQGTDTACIDLKTPIAVPAITLVDPRTIIQGAEMFVIDSNLKRVPVTFVAAMEKTAENQNGVQLLEASPSSNAQHFSCVDANDFEVLWQHDSGDLFFVELQAPTSLAAGDGVLGLIAGHIYTNSIVKQPIQGDQLVPLQATPTCTNVNTAAMTAWNTYWQNRGVSYVWNSYPRGSQPVAQQTTEQQINAVYAQIVSNI